MKLGSINGRMVLLPDKVEAGYVVSFADRPGQQHDPKSGRYVGKGVPAGWLRDTPPEGVSFYDPKVGKFIAKPGTESSKGDMNTAYAHDHLAIEIGHKHCQGAIDAGLIRVNYSGRNNYLMKEPVLALEGHDSADVMRSLRGISNRVAVDTQVWFDTNLASGGGALREIIKYPSLQKFPGAGRPEGYYATHHASEPVRIEGKTYYFVEPIVGTRPSPGAVVLEFADKPGQSHDPKSGRYLPKGGLGGGPEKFKPTKGVMPPHLAAYWAKRRAEKGASPKPTPPKPKKESVWDRPYQEIPVYGDTKGSAKNIQDCAREFPPDLNITRITIQPTPGMGGFYNSAYRDIAISDSWKQFSFQGGAKHMRPEFRRAVLHEMAHGAHIQDTPSTHNTMVELQKVHWQHVLKGRSVGLQEKVAAKTMQGAQSERDHAWVHIGLIRGRMRGNRPVTDYAFTNVREYVAETVSYYLASPSHRDLLKKNDPRAYDVMERTWPRRPA